MDATQDAESLKGSKEEWQNGQDLSQNVADTSYSDSEQSAESSSETYSTMEQGVYSKGMFTDFSGEGIYGIMGTGVIIGFAVSIFLGFISKWIADTMSLFGKGEE